MRQTGTLHEEIRAWREAKGMTALEVANSIGTRKGQVYRWESGKHLDVKDFARLARIYNIRGVDVARAILKSDLRD